jgi:hypothetical protein
MGETDTGAKELDRVTAFATIYQITNWESSRKESPVVLTPVECEGCGIDEE